MIIKQDISKLIYGGSDSWYIQFADRSAEEIIKLFKNELAAKDAEIERLTKERDEWKNRFGKTPKEIDGRISMWEEMQPEIDRFKKDFSIERKALEEACDYINIKTGIFFEISSDNKSHELHDYFRKLAREKK